MMSPLYVHVRVNMWPIKKTSRTATGFTSLLSDLFVLNEQIIGIIYGTQVMLAQAPHTLYSIT